MSDWTAKDFQYQFLMIFLQILKPEKYEYNNCFIKLLNYHEIYIIFNLIIN